MREIKFRGRRVDNGEWIHGSLANYSRYISYIIVDLLECVFKFNEIYSVLFDTIGQYTGLKDKNGVEIYEGDIIDIHQTVNGCNLFEIVWDKTRWNAKYAVEMVKPRLYEYNFNELLDVEEDETELEIVGNIYDGVGK